MSEREPLKILAFGYELEVREPKHEDLDLGLVERLLQQLAKHEHAEIRVEPGEGASLRLDRIMQLQADCMDQITRRIRAYLLRCTARVRVLSVEKAEGVPEVWDAPSADRLAEIFPAPEDANISRWWGAFEQILLYLRGRARLGKS